MCDECGSLMYSQEGYPSITATCLGFILSSSLPPRARSSPHLEKRFRCLLGFWEPPYSPVVLLEESTRANPIKTSGTKEEMQYLTIPESCYRIFRRSKIFPACLPCALPKELFPQLFLDAFHFVCIDTLKAIGQIWPFPSLPLGTLLDKAIPCMESLEAVLDGIDLLLAQEVRPRRCKLQVLDFCLSGDRFWNQWCDIPVRWHQETNPPLSVGSCIKGHTSALLEVVIDLTVGIGPLSKVQARILQWAKARKNIHLCCRKITFLHVPTFVTCLNDIEFTCVQEIEVDLCWKISNLVSFAPMLGQMRNLQRLNFSTEPPHSTTLMTMEGQQQFVALFSKQFLLLNSLRELYLDSATFLKGRMNQVLRCLTTHLETLSIMMCTLLIQDMTQMSQCPNLNRLKKLSLSGTYLRLLSIPLRGLLENCASTLQDLDLGVCGLQDTHLKEILPGLKLCSQLRALKLHGNGVSMATLVQVVRHLADLPHLMLEIYPAPLESYSSPGKLHQRSFDLLCAEMTNVLRDIGKPRSIFLSTKPCTCCVKSISHNCEPKFLPVPK
ncbi:PRAME family member 12-like [Suncus etruscus]|uniref:PRAME family member 12-like n=1 Tax=Suncus etruscus TaxID=109475 RepID=UPI00210F23AE|nr:PRAME family member 12-like [Suncus etruscus]